MNEQHFIVSKPVFYMIISLFFASFVIAFAIPTYLTHQAETRVRILNRCNLK